MISNIKKQFLKNKIKSDTATKLIESILKYCLDMDTMKASEYIYTSINTSIMMKQDDLPILTIVILDTLDENKKNKLVDIILEVAKKEGNLEKMLLFKDEYSFMPLHYALTKGHHLVVETLLSKASLDVTKTMLLHDEGRAQLPIMIACTKDDDEIVNCLLPILKYGEKTNIIKELLLSKGLMSSTTLCVAIKKCNGVRLLLEYAQKHGVLRELISLPTHFAFVPVTSFDVIKYPQLKDTLLPSVYMLLYYASI